FQFASLRAVKNNTLLILSAAAFVLLSGAVGGGLLYPLDARVLEAAQSRPSEVLDVAGTLLSVLGGVEFVGVAAISLSCGLVLGGRRALAVRLLVALVATGLVELALKMALPQAPVPDGAMRTPDPSFFDLDTPYPFPSGHMLRVVILLGAIYVLWPHRLARVVLLVLLICSAASRVYLGTHWPTDVVGGALLGVIGLLWMFRGIGQRVLKPET
ncbi:MAG: phosphatase PAP2 family protein, partial [Rubrobacter sp.]